MIDTVHLAPYAASVCAGLLMVRAGAAKRLVESRRRPRWCAACHRRVERGRCGCARRG